jgi:hypothetical protein
MDFFGKKMTKNLCPKFFSKGYLNITSMSLEFLKSYESMSLENPMSL